MGLLSKENVRIFNEIASGQAGAGPETCRPRLANN